MARRRYRQPQRLISDRYRITSEIMPQTTMSAYTIHDTTTGELVGEAHQWPSLGIAEAAALRHNAGLDPDPLGTYTPRNVPNDLPF